MRSEGRKTTKVKWNERDRFEFSTARLRASSIPGRRFEGPGEDEWDWSDDMD